MNANEPPTVLSSDWTLASHQTYWTFNLQLAVSCWVGASWLANSWISGAHCCIRLKVEPVTSIKWPPCDSGVLCYQHFQSDFSLCLRYQHVVLSSSTFSSSFSSSSSSSSPGSCQLIVEPQCHMLPYNQTWLSSSVAVVKSSEVDMLLRWTWLWWLLPPTETVSNILGC